MTLIVRPAGPEDADAIALVAAATFLETFADILRGPDIVAHCRNVHTPATYAALAAQFPSAWLAETHPQGTPVGYSALGDPDLPLDQQEGDLELKRIYLLSRFHGGGTGRALLEPAIDEARRRGARRLLLGVFQENHRAIALYRKAGFEPVGRRVYRVGDNGYDDLTLALTL